MKFKKGDKVICIEEWDEHNPRGYGIHVGKLYTVTGTYTLKDFKGKKYQMLKLKGFKKLSVNCENFIKL